MARLTIQIGASIKSLKDKLGRAKSSFRRFFAGIKKLGALGGLGFVGLIYGMNRLSNAAREFNTKMREVNTIAQGSKKELKELTRIVVDLSSTMGIDAVVAADSMYQALSAGIDKAKIKDFLQIAARASIAGVTDMKTAVDGLTTVIKAYGLTADNASKISDIFFETIRLGKTTFPELSQDIGKVAPIAAKMGIGFEEIAAALATMTKQGIKTDIAAVSLRGILSQLLSPNEKLAKGLQEVAKQAGVADWHALSLQQVLKGLGDVTNNDSSKINEMIPNVRALTGVLALMGESSKMAADDLADIADSSDAAKKAFNEFADSSDLYLKRQEQQLKRAGRAWGDLFTSIKVNSAKGALLLKDLAVAVTYKGKNQESVNRTMLGMRTAEDIIKDVRARFDASKDSKEKNMLLEQYNVLVRKGAFAWEKLVEQQKKSREVEAEVTRKEKEKSAKTLAITNAEISAKEKANELAKKAKEKADKEAKTKQETVNKELQSMQNKIQVQNLINQGKSKEAYIQQEVNKLKAMGANEEQIAQTKKLAAQQYELQNARKIAEQRGAVMQDFARQEMPIVTDALRRIGGNIGNGKAIDDTSKKTLDALVKTKDRVDEIDYKLQYMIANPTTGRAR
jgi:TP901 family phage tail tape measure protein